MATESAISDELRRRIGVEFEPARYEIEKEAIRRWAEAIGDPNPLYHDEKFAQSLGHKSIPAPPGFIGTYLFPVKGPTPWPRLFPDGLFIQTGNDFEIFETVYAGDVLIARTKIVELREREDKSGSGTLVLQTSETNFRNQHQKLIVRQHGYGIVYPTRWKRSS